MSQGAQVSVGDALLDGVFSLVESVAQDANATMAATGSDGNDRSASWAFAYALTVAKRHPEWAAAIATRYEKVIAPFMLDEVGMLLVQTFPIQQVDPSSALRTSGVTAQPPMPARRTTGATAEQCCRVLREPQDEREGGAQDERADTG